MSDQLSSPTRRIIFRSGGLQEVAVIRKFRNTADDSKRHQTFLPMGGNHGQS